MPIEILMPALSPTMTEGTLARWLKKEGDSVSSGEVIAEIETDKATMEVESIEDGVLGKVIIDGGTDGVPVNSVIALLLEEGEDKSSLDSYEVKQPEKATEAPQESAEPSSDNSDEAPKAQSSSNSGAPALGGAPKFDIVASPKHLSTIRVSDYSDDRLKVSPVAKGLAESANVDLSMVQGTGPRGRIVKSDVEEAIKFGVSGNRIIRNPVDYEELPNDNMRKVIAKRLLESKQYVPHFYLNIDCNLDDLLQVRQDINNEATSHPETGKPAYKVSVNDFIIKAVAKALRKVPQANASWTDEAIVQYNNVDVSVAVAVDGGLITPIIRSADQKTLPYISSEMKNLAGKARKGKLSPEEYQGGGFSISNLGMYGIKNFNAIINPPQSCILAVGMGEKRPVIDNEGKVKAATVMSVTLSCDHRVVDGAVGAEFLQAFKSYIEKPVKLFM